MSNLSQFERFCKLHIRKDGNQPDQPVVGRHLLVFGLGTMNLSEPRPQLLFDGDNGDTDRFINYRQLREKFGMTRVPSVHQDGKVVGIEQDHWPGLLFSTSFDRVF